jgi:rRNA maturation endonuclease Nob1
MNNISYLNKEKIFVRLNKSFFCIKCKENFRNGRSKFCFDCLQEIKYERDKRYGLRRQN